MDITEWYQQNADSPFEYEDESYTNSNGCTTVFIPCLDYTEEQYNLHLKTIDEVVEKLEQKYNYHLSLFNKPDPADINTFWNFQHLDQDNPNELCGINADWFSGISYGINFNYYMEKELFEEVSLCFPSENIHKCSKYFDVMLSNLRALQIKHHRITRIKELIPEE